MLGPLSTDELGARWPSARRQARVSRRSADRRRSSTSFARANRVLRATIAGEQRWAVIEDASPPARCARGAAAARGAERVPRPGRRSGRRPGQPLRAHPRPVHRSGCRDPPRSRRRDRHRRPAPARERPARGRGRVPAGRDRVGVGRRRGAAAPAVAVARGAALRGRAGSAGHARALPARLAARRRPERGPAPRDRRPGQRDRPARRGGAAGIHLGEPRAAQPGCATTAPRCSTS